MGGLGNQLNLGKRLEAGGAWTRDNVFSGRRGTFAVGAIVALLAWPLGIGIATASLDASWMSGLYMGIEHGKDFGSQIVFTYGPLGFLDWPNLWSSWLAVLAAFFCAAMYVTFTVTFIGLMRRTVGLLAAGVIAFIYLATIPDMEQLPLILAVAWSLTALRDDRPGFAVDLLAVGGGSLAAIECLIKLSTGPVIFLICLLAMIGARPTRRQWGLFAGCFVGGVVVLWLVAGQPIGSLWDYASNGSQVIRGYNEAMEVNGAPTWAKVFVVLFAIGLLLAAYLAPTRDRRARWAAVLLMAVAAFSSYKYAIVRFEPVHLTFALSAMLGFWLVLPWRRSLSPAYLLSSVLLGLVILHLVPTPARLDPIHNVIAFGEEVEMAARPGKRQEYVNFGRSILQSTYALDPKTLELLKGKRVEIDPWEIAVAWAYELDWSPLPVFQNYTAYTQKLDRLNSEAVEDAETGPQMILRSNPGGPAPLGGSRSFESRQPAWDPPEQNFKILCNFTPVYQTSAWQVLERVPDRCGEEKLIGEAETNPGEAVQIPQAKKGQAVLMKIEGAKVEGIEKLRSLLLRPRVRIASLNEGLVAYRLIPDTTEDGMVVSRDPRLDGSEQWEQYPEVTDLKVEGISKHLHYKFYAVPVKVEKPPAEG